MQASTGGYQTVKKGILRCFSFVAIFSHIAANTTLAQEQSCTTCHTTPPMIQTYIDFSYDLLQLITLVGDRNITLGQAVTPGLFQKNILPIANKPALDQIITTQLQQANQIRQTTTTTTIVLAKELLATPGDLLMGLTAIHQARAIHRDYQKILDLDQRISNKLLQLGQSAAYNATLTDNDQQSIQAIFDHYQEILWTPDSSISTQSLTYRSLITVLQRLQGKIKPLILHGHTRLLRDANNTSRMTQAGNNSISLAFPNDDILATQQAYTCARYGDVCNSMLADFGQIMQNLAKQQGKRINQSIQRITDSTRRLQRLRSDYDPNNPNYQDKTPEEKDAIKHERQNYEAREHHLASSYRGLYGKYHTDTQGLGDRSNPAIKGSLIQGLLHNDDSTTANQKNQSKNKDNKKTLPDTQTSFDPVAPQNIDQILTQSLTATLTNLHRQADQAQVAQAIADPTIATRTIVTLVQQVQQAATLIGNKEAQKSIYRNLGLACENQCTNLPTVCR